MLEGRGADRPVTAKGKIGSVNILERRVAIVRRELMGVDEIGASDGKLARSFGLVLWKGLDQISTIVYDKGLTQTATVLRAKCSGPRPE